MDFPDGEDLLDLQSCFNGWWKREIALEPPKGVFLRRENVEEVNEMGLTEGDEYNRTFLDAQGTFSTISRRAGPQPSDEKATASSYVLNPTIISMVEANKFFGVKEENPYTHLQDLEALCQTFHHEGVPRDLYWWLLFPFSLGGKVIEWHKAASREAKGKWSELVGNFCLHYFPLPKVQKLRREVVNFLQEDEESLAEAWTRFQTLLKQGPDLGIDENMCAQTFYMAINKESRMHLDGSAGGSFLRLTAKVGIELLGKIAENNALHKHWEEYLEPNRQCLEVMKKEESPAEQILMSESRSMITSGQFEEIEPIELTSVGLTCVPIGAVSEPIDAVATTGELITLTTPPSSKEYTKIEAAILDNQLKEFEGNFSKPKGDRTLANAKPLDKFEPMDWIPINISQELLNMRRSFNPQDASEAEIEYNFSSNRLKSEVFDQEIIGRILGKLYKDDIDLDGTEVKQAKRLLDSCFEPSPYEGLCGVYAVGVTEDEKEEPYIPCEISGKKFPKALCDFGSCVSLMTYDAFMSMPYGTQQRLIGTELELIMADGRKTKPLGVIKNVKIEISSKTMPVDFSL
ncbi:hypothetical protein PR202_ga20842 [Eleusine coracana subsp. coracana]|uniref:Retrotransposon gag domain-containing protein n=1 Tax=Eleusine coracana subsp. coracana TaxID=191504 RepID=A0AAV5CZ00_ELECO|nr:hypothetical protein PR202_ga20842 [Eleusine coracana subsp. coracana]